MNMLINIEKQLNLVATVMLVAKYRGVEQYQIFAENYCDERISLAT